MRRIKKIHFFIIFITLILGFSIYKNTDQTILPRTLDVKNAIIVGWDATQRDHLYELLDNGKLPNLKKFISSGSIIDITITTGTTSTKPGWAEILTGYGPDITGVYSNFDYKPIPQGYTIFERLEEYFKKEGITTAFISGKRHGTGAKGSHEICLNCIPAHRNYVRSIIELEDAGTLGRSTDVEWWEINGAEIHLPGVDPIFERRDGEPYYYTKDTIDTYVIDLGGANSVGEEAIDFLNKYKEQRFFAFFHFGDADTAGHEYGENSIEYSNAIIIYDQWFGDIISKLKEMEIENETLVYITSDHGFDEGRKTHENASDFFLATNNREIVKDGDRKDIAPTLLWNYGFDIKSIFPSLSGTVLAEEK